MFADIRRTRGATESYLPWLRAMRPEDRLYVIRRSNDPPSIPGLEWFQPVYSIWARRLPRGVGAPAQP